MTRDAVENVLQVNVRLSEGGAAGVARTLADGLRSVGVRSPFAYGYSHRGRSSPLEGAYDGVRITPAPVAALNRLSFYLNGEETSVHGSREWDAFKNAVRQADVVHLHAVHSHIARVRDLVDLLIQNEKPTVWTMHDQWLFTGRCAQPGLCRLWETGCPKCPDMAAYPPGLIDKARVHWPTRRELLDRLRDAVPFALVSCAEWLADEADAAGLGPVRTVTNSVDQEFWAARALGATSVAAVGAQTLRCLFLCRDLRDKQKIDWTVLHMLAATPGVGLTVMGNHAPPSAGTLKITPAVSRREELAETMGSHDALIFLSTVDYFPLTVAEALTSGLTVFAIDSLAAREFSAESGLRLFGSSEELLDAVRAAAADHDVSPVQRTRATRFEPSKMVDAYRVVYEELLRG